MTKTKNPKNNDSDIFDLATRGDQRPAAKTVRHPLSLDLRNRHELAVEVFHTHRDKEVVLQCLFPRSTERK